MKIESRSSFNVGEAGIDAGGSELEAGTTNWMKKYSRIDLTSFVTSIDFHIRTLSFLRKEVSRNKS
jgi:hypothetical protein